MACPSALISSGPCLQMEALGKLASARTVCGTNNLYCREYDSYKRIKSSLLTNFVTMPHTCQHREKLRRKDSWNIL